MTTDAQSHSGAVGGGTPAVSYAFADGSGGNTARRTSLTYPDGRVVAFGYGSAGTLDERLYATMDYFNATAAPDADGDVVERYAYPGAVPRSRDRLLRLRLSVFRPAPRTVVQP